ncbi:Pectinesterase [Quillaja saponaria]|uniref:Pectinesterase n=1 Tax=Quillaja saponaria TaxID=32244 RepID=A0AAD7Q1F4_QUISA|nr:Pectinesterase [Quillaja saponaria]
MGVVEALCSYLKNYRGRYIIYVKAGIYHEIVLVDKTMTNVFMYGDGPARTVVTGRECFFPRKPRHGRPPLSLLLEMDSWLRIWHSRTQLVHKDTKQWHLRVQSDMSAFLNCRISGYQDTLYYQRYTQFYRDCEISGTIDFIFGTGTALIQNSKIIERKPLPNQFNTVTADGTEFPNLATGLVIQNCEIIPEPQLFPQRLTVKSYLGRPWKQSSTTVVMESCISDVIQPVGWTPWDNTNFGLDRSYLADYNNRGPGAATNGRVRWKGFRVINANEAARFTAGTFISGRLWLGGLGVPHYLGLNNH